MTTILLIIALIIIVPLLIAAFLPKNYGVESHIVINRPKHEVFDYVKLLKNQDHYSKWVQKDPEMHKDFRGIDGTIGFVYGWNSSKGAGEGEQEIMGVTDGERITTEIRFKRPMATTAHIYQTTEAVSEHSTKVTWGMTGHSNYPSNLMTALLKGALKKDMDLSLQQLKAVLEQK